jgi:hypothetical protein
MSDPDGDDAPNTTRRLPEYKHQVQPNEQEDEQLVLVGTTTVNKPKYRTTIQEPLPTLSQQQQQQIPNSPPTAAAASTVVVAAVPAPSTVFAEAVPVDDLEEGNHHDNNIEPKRLSQGIEWTCYCSVQKKTVYWMVSIVAVVVVAVVVIPTCLLRVWSVLHV